MMKGIILVTYKVYNENGVRTLIDYFVDLAHFKEFRRKNRNTIELVSYKEI